MTNDAEGTALSIVAGAVSGLAAPVRTPFLKALSDLLGGLTAIPAAKLKQYAQAIEDTTAARSTVAATIAKGVGTAGLVDPLLMQAAAEIYLPTALRKAKNRVSVAEKAAEHIADHAGDNPSAAAPEDDWMNLFARFAEDASSEKLQDLFGRILAGQVVRPGSFAQSTIRAVGELDHAIATDFSLVWAKSVGEAVDYSSEFQRGEWFARWQRLAEAGLMASRETAQFLPPYTPVIGDIGFWSPMSAGLTMLLVRFPQHCVANWKYIGFTRVGRELGSILVAPDYAQNMRAAGEGLARQGVARIELHTAGKPVELIYQSAH